MQFLSLQPFIPSGPDFESAKDFFSALGFNISWDGGDYVGFEKEGCKFILQKYNNKTFAENLMITVGITNADEMWKNVNEIELAKKFRIQIKPPFNVAYGRELNIIDLAGVCWHFVES